MPSLSFADARQLARAATLIENRRPEAEALLADVFPQTGRALLIGVTGAPGAGKSTLVDQMVRTLRAEGQRVGVIAVDPSSAWTGGAILGDRVRMQDHHADPNVFIRSMATRGRLGGVAAATLELALLLDAAGADTVIIETVGVGQDEVEVARLASVTVVILVPGMGDDIQAIKAGIMEIADLIVINKSDYPGSDTLEHQLRTSQVTVPVLRTVATDGRGTVELIAAMRTIASGRSNAATQTDLWRGRLRELVRERLLERLQPESLDREAAEVAARTRDPFTAVDNLIKEML